MIGYSILHYANDREMQINEVFKILDGRIRLLIDNIGFRRVQIGHGAAGILMDWDGNRAFIACGPDNYVAVLNLKTLEVASHIDVGGEPDGLAWAIRP